MGIPHIRGCEPPSPVPGPPSLFTFTKNEQ